jgi:UDP-3-O-[3-hydroxymyristoyl] glucosamine N-acyltransferase
MHKTIKEIAKIINGEVIGRDDILITGASGIKEASEGDITFLANPRYAPMLETTHASAVITSRDVSGCAKPIIRTDNPSLAFASVLEFIAPAATVHPQGIHKTAIIGANVVLGKGVGVGAYTVIEDNVVIGDHTILYPHCYIGRDTMIGSKALLYPHVSVRERIQIGNRVIIHNGAVIGADGFGYATVNGEHHRIPQTGTVIIEDDVDIGANVTIDRARFDKTVIGKGTKIDNLVQIAHNVVTGKNCIIVSQAGISGSTVLGDNVTLAGQVGVAGHVTLGDNVVVSAQSGISKSVPAGTAMYGYPAKPADVYKRVNACVQNLPRLFNTVTQLKKRIEELEEKLRLKDNG